MALNYDIWNNARPCDIYLSRSNKRLLGVLNGVRSAKLNLKLLELSYLEIEVDKNIDGLLTNFYDSIDAAMEIYVPEFGWFYIKDTPRIEGNGDNESKTFTAYSYESTLQNHDLQNFYINMGTTTSKEHFEGNLDPRTEIPLENIRFYYPDKPSLSLLHLVLEDIPIGWKIGHIDTQLMRRERSFDVDTRDIYSFLLEEVSKSFRCIIRFDSVNMTINAYDVETFGEDTSICISYSNILKNALIEAETNKLFTAFTVAGDGLNIDLVNFGNSEIVNLNYVLNKQFKQDTINKYKTYIAKVEELREKYIEYQLAYAEALDKKTELESRAPIDIVSTEWAAYTLDELRNELEIAKNVVTYIEKLYQSIGQSITAESPDYAIYHSYKDIIIPDINTEIKRKENGVVESADKVDYDTMWDLYGLSALNEKRQSYEEQISIYIKNHYDNRNSADAQQIPEDLWNKNHEEYIGLNQKLAGCKTAIKKREQEVNTAQTIMNDNQSKAGDIARQSKIENKSYNFTDDELSAIYALYRHTDYTDKNIQKTNSDLSTVNMISTQRELLESAKKQLEIESQPQIEFSIDTDNPFYIEEFEQLRQGLDIGNFIYVELENNYHERLRVIELGFSIINWDEDMSIKFSSTTTAYGHKDDFDNLLDDLTSSTKNSINADVKSATDAAVQQLWTNLLSRMSLAVNGNSLNNLSTVYAKFGQIEADYIRTKELTAEIAKIGDLTADSAFIKNLDALLVNAVKLNVTELNAEVAKFKDMVAGNILVEDGYVFNFTAKNAHLDEAFIRDFIATKITALVLTSAKITSNDLVIQTDEGSKGMKLVGNTMQFYDSDGKVGIQLGYDTEGNPNLIICDKNGNVMLDGAGLHEAIIPDKFIKSNMVGKGEIKQENLDLTNIQEWRNANGTPVFDISKFKYNDEEFSNSYESHIQKVEQLSTMVDSIELIGSQVFTQAQNGSITPSSITVKAVVKNNAAVSRWLIDGTVITSGVSADKLSITIPSSTFTNKRSILLRAENATGSIYDEFSMYKVVDGEDAVNIVLSNENCSFASTYNGIAEAVTTTTSITAYKGSQIIPCTVGTIQGIPAGMTATVKNNGTSTAYVEIEVTPKLTGDSGILHIPVTASGVTVTKDFIWNKTKHATQPVNVVFSNESDNLPADEDGRISVLTTLITTFTAYKGTNIVPCIVTPPATLPSGMTITQTTSDDIVTVKIFVESKATLGDVKSLYGHIDFDIEVDGTHFTKQFSWVKSRTGAQAKTVSIVASSQIFKSKDGGMSFLPETIALNPTLQGTTFSKWQYSTDGGKTWTDITSGISGLSINQGILSISKDCSLFTDTVTAVGFKVLTNVSGVTDTITIIKLYDLKVYGGSIIVDGGKSIETTLTDIQTYNLSEDLVENEKYTLVIKGSVNKGNKIGLYFIEAYNPYIDTDDSNTISDVDGNGLVSVSWYKGDLIWTGINSQDTETSTVTLTTPSYLGDNRGIGFANYPEDTATNAEIEWVCLYKGDVNAPDGYIPNFTTIESTVVEVERKTDNNTKSINDKVWKNDTYNVLDKNGNPITITMQTMLVEHHQDINGFTETVNKHDKRITTAQQTADKFYWLVENKPESSASSFTITDKFIDIASSALNINALTTFKNSAENGTNTVISGGSIKTNTINGDRIMANTITGDKIKANTINGDRIVAGTITGDKIKANTIDSDRIMANSITGDKIKADSITGDKIKANTINGNRIAANTITSAQITTKNISGTHGWINLSEGKFNYSDKLIWDGANLTVNGIVNATSGTFRGTVYANDGEFTGKITATSGSFTGDITSSNARITGGTLSVGTLFSVTQNGNLYTNTPNILNNIKIASDIYDALINDRYDFFAGYISSILRVGKEGSHVWMPTITATDITSTGRIYAYGNISCLGTKSRIADTLYGKKLLYCFETPSPIFGDAGSANTDTDGICYVSIDPIFAETIDLSQEPIIMLTKYGPGDIWVDEVSVNYFIVKGNANLRFDWMIMAKQRDYSLDRLEDCTDEFEEDMVIETNYSDELCDKNIFDFYKEEETR